MNILHYIFVLRGTGCGCYPLSLICCTVVNLCLSPWDKEHLHNFGYCHKSVVDHLSSIDFFSVNTISNCYPDDILKNIPTLCLHTNSSVTSFPWLNGGLSTYVVSLGLLAPLPSLHYTQNFCWGALLLLIHSQVWQTSWTCQLGFLPLSLYRLMLFMKPHHLLLHEVTHDYGSNQAKICKERIGDMWVSLPIS